MALNLRTIVLVGALAVCVGVYVRYDHLRREAIEMPRADQALLGIRSTGRQFAEMVKFGLRQSVDGWTSACVKQPGNGRVSPYLGKLYLEQIARTAEFIDNAEAAGAFSSVLRRSTDTVAQLRALRDWLHAEAASDQAWSCANSGMLDKLQRLKEIYAVHAECLGRLTQAEAMDVVQRRIPSLDDCTGALHALPLPDHAAAAPASTPAATSGHERVVSWTRSEPGDEVLELAAERGRARFLLSPDGSRVAWVVGRQGKQYVVLDGEVGPAFDTVRTGVGGNVLYGGPGGPVFSANSRHFAYEGERDGKWFVVIDGEPGEGWDAIGQLVLAQTGGRWAYSALRDHHWRAIVDGTHTDYPSVSPRFTFSADASRLAWVTNDDGGFAVVVDGKRSAPYRAIVLGPGFSPDGRRVGYIARSRERLVAVVDGREMPAYDGPVTWGVVFSPDSQRFAYVAWRNRRMVAVVDGVEGREYDKITTPTFSADSRRWLYAASSGGRWVVVVDGHESRPYDAILAPGPAFSPDGHHFGYGAKDAWQTRVVIDDRDEPAFDNIVQGSPVWSADSAHVGYVASRGGRGFAVLDGTASSAYEHVSGNVSFSPDSARWAWVVGQEDGWHVVVNGREGPPYEGVLGPGAVWSPDSRHVACVVKKGGQEVVVEDGAEHRAYHDIDEASLRWSPDSAHLAYAAWDGGWTLVVDRVETGARFAAFAKGSAPRFTAGGRVQIVAQPSPGDFARVEVELPSAAAAPADVAGAR